MALEVAVDESLPQEEIAKAIQEDPTIHKISRIISILNIMKMALTSLYQLIKTAKLIDEWNPYLV